MSNPYVGLTGFIRQQGQALAAPGVQLGTVRSLSPLTLYIGGAVLTDGLYAPPWMLDDAELPPVPVEMEPWRAFFIDFLESVRLAVGDAVAVKRAGEDNIILCKVVSV